MSTNSSASSRSGISLDALVAKAADILGPEIDHAVLKCLLSQSQILRDCVMNRPEELPGMMDEEVVILTGDDLDTIQDLSVYVNDRMELNSDVCPSGCFVLTPEDKKSYEHDSSPEIRNVFAFLKRFSNGEPIGEYIESDFDGSVSIELYPSVLPHPRSFLAEDTKGVRAPEPSTLEYLMFSKPTHGDKVKALIKIGMLVPSTAISHPHGKPQPKRRVTAKRKSHSISMWSNSYKSSSSSRYSSDSRRSTRAAKAPQIRLGSSNIGKPGQIYRGKTQKRGRSPRRKSPRGTRRRQ